MRTSIQFFLYLFFVANFSFGQVTLNMPVTRSVFQRVNNQANIQIGGNSDVFIAQLQARLIVRQGGTALDWTTINTNIEPGTFRAQLMNVTGGWYDLEIRALHNGNVVGSAMVERIGVGEVFIVAGQSNAEGGRNTWDFSSTVYYGAVDDRVNAINYFTNDPNQSYPFPQIIKIPAETDIAPKGKSSWCWALLGDKIASQWNVPVLIFNAAVGATTALQWSNSANNNTEPFIFLKKSLEYYAKIFGVRSVLWHQGESDIFQFSENYPQSCTNYQSNILNTIQKSRNALGANVPWVISKVSRWAQYTDGNLVNCQQAIANMANVNCFEGPATDQIQPGPEFRDGTLHFRAEGFIELADVWFNSINTPNFINNAIPIPASNNLKVEAGQFSFGSSLAPCVGTNQSLNSGNWASPATWSCGVVPISLNEIIITAGHTVTISTPSVFVKNLTINGELLFENNGNLTFCDY